MSVHFHSDNTTSSNEQGFEMAFMEVAGIKSIFIENYQHRTVFKVSRVVEAAGQQKEGKLLLPTTPNHILETSIASI